MATNALTVVIPIRNEAGNLRALYRGLEYSLEDVAHEVVLVDDSDDALTRPLLREIVAADSRWRAIERPLADQTGLATAVCEGIAVATGQVVCVMDGDLQHPPSVIRQLLQAIAGGADLAVASRYVAGGNAGGLSGLVRTAVSSNSSRLVRLLFPEARRSTDPLSGFFCVRREAVVGLELRPIGFKILLELLVCLPEITIADVPYRFGARDAGTSKANLSQGVLFLRHLLSLFVYVPLSALAAKIVLAVGAGIGVFVGAMAAGDDLPLPRLMVWTLATLAGLVSCLAIYKLVTLGAAREWSWRSGKLSRSRLTGYASASGGLATFSLLVLTGSARLAFALLALVAEAMALVIRYGLAVVRRHLGHPAPDGGRYDGAGISDLARHLGHVQAWWLEPGATALAEELLRMGVTVDLVRHVEITRQPLLVVGLPSGRLQARTNVYGQSMMIIPRLNRALDVDRVAVLARSAKVPFSGRDLRLSLTWLNPTEQISRGAVSEPLPTMSNVPDAT